MNKIALEILKEEEGFRPYVYDDKKSGKEAKLDWNLLRKKGILKGRATWGFGWNIEIGIDKDVAEYFLKKRINFIEEQIRERKSVFDRLSEVRQAVLICMGYQLGINGLMGFKKMWKAIEDDDWDKVGFEMKDSGWYRQTTSRAKRMIKYMINDGI